MRGLRLLPVLLIAPASAWAAFGGGSVGTTTAGFLKLGVGARAVAMGEACAAAADDATAMYWNPAGLRRIEGRSLAFMHGVHLDGSFFDYGAWGQRLGERGAVGASIQYFSAGELTETDATGTTLGTFTPNDLAFALGYAYELPRGLTGGLAVKLIRSSIKESAMTGAVDLGVQTAPMMNDRLRLGFTATNLGGKLKFEAEGDDLPLALRAGGAYRVSEGWSAVFDAVFPRDNHPFAALGTEYLWQRDKDWSLAGRAGFNSRTLGDVSGFTGVSFGLGLDYRGFSVDYAFLPLGSIGLTHRVSLSFNMGRGAGSQASRPARTAAAEQADLGDPGARRRSGLQ